MSRQHYNPISANNDEHEARLLSRAERAFQLFAYGCSEADSWGAAASRTLGEITFACDQARKDGVLPRALLARLGFPSERHTTYDAATALPWGWWYWQKKLLEERGFSHLSHLPRSAEALLSRNRNLPEPISMSQ